MRAKQGGVAGRWAQRLQRAHLRRERSHLDGDATGPQDPFDTSDATLTQGRSMHTGTYSRFTGFSRRSGRRMRAWVT